MTETLFVSSDEYDYHSLLKVAEINGQLGQIQICDTEGGYMVIFRECVANAARIYERRLQNLTNNIWSY